MAHWQGKFVHNDYQFLYRNFFFFEPIPHSLPAQIHERAGLNGYNSPPFDAELGTVAVASSRKGCRMTCCPCVQKIKPNVVASTGIFNARIPQPHHQELFHLFRTCLCGRSFFNRSVVVVGVGY